MRSLHRFLRRKVDAGGSRLAVRTYGIPPGGIGPLVPLDLERGGGGGAANLPGFEVEYDDKRDIFICSGRTI